jgi:hypothetical protein
LINKETGEDACNFANDIDKLVPIVCFNANKVGGCKNNNCTYFHPDIQTKQEYADVNGFVFKKSVQKIEEKIEEPIQLEKIEEKIEEPIQLEKIEESVFEDLIKEVEKEMKEIEIQTEEILEEEKTVIQYVPFYVPIYIPVYEGFPAPIFVTSYTEEDEIDDEIENTIQYEEDKRDMWDDFCQDQDVIDLMENYDD